MDPTFQGPRGYSENDNLEDRMGEEPARSESGDGRRRGRRRSRPRNPPLYLPINTARYALRPGEDVTPVNFMHGVTGDAVGFPNAFISPYWPDGAIAGRLSDALCYPRITLPQNCIQRFMTPRGPIQSREAALATFCLANRPNQPVQAMLPILEHQLYGHFGVPMIVGRSLLRYLDSQERLLSQNIPDRISAAAPESANNTFEVLDFPNLTPWSESATITDTVDNWLANSVHIPE